MSAREPASGWNIGADTGPVSPANGKLTQTIQKHRCLTHWPNSNQGHLCRSALLLAVSAGGFGHSEKVAHKAKKTHTQLLAFWTLLKMRAAFCTRFAAGASTRCRTFLASQSTPWTRPAENCLRKSSVASPALTSKVLNPCGNSSKWRQHLRRCQDALQSPPLQSPLFRNPHLSPLLFRTRLLLQTTHRLHREALMCACFACT